MTLLLSSISGGPPPVEEGGGESLPTTLYAPVWHNIVRVGPSRTFTTFESAVTAVKNDGDVWASTNPSAGTYGGGWYTGAGRLARYRTVLVFDPGVYTISSTSMIDTPGGIDLLGATGNRDDVVIETGLGSLSYIFNARNDFFAAHLTMRIPARGETVGKSYAIHMTGMTLDKATSNIYVNVHIQDLEPLSRSGGPLGWDGPDNSILYLKDCLVSSARSMILHGDLAPINIKVVSHDTVYNSPTLPGVFEGSDAYYWNCTQNGTPVPNERKQYGFSPVALGSTSELPTVANGTHIPTRYSPSTETEGEKILTPSSDPGDLGPVALPAGTVYYVPIEPLFAGKVKHIAATFTTVVGNVALGLYSGKISDTDVPNDIGIYQNTPVSAAALATRLPIPDFSPIYITRDHPCWLAILVTDAAARVQGSSLLSATKTCYKSTSTQTGVAAWPVALTAVPASDPVPWLSLVIE